MISAEEIKQLALDLVGIASVVETSGEVTLANFIYDTCHDLPYFKENPDNLVKIPLPEDPLGRFAVLALVEGACDSKKTVVTVGHFDTVGLSDYGSLKDLSTKPVALTAAMKEVPLSPDAKKDLASGNYLFGRGLLDMKSGDAILMSLIKHYSEHREELKGNLIYLAVGDEEANSKGMLAALPVLSRLKQERGFDYQCLLDTDYTTLMYPEDPHRYLFVGTVGKLMPAFYVVGKETHVGEAFRGLDANYVAAAILTRINMNPEFCDTVDQESTLPPVSLRLRDLKAEYTVQTARTAHLFFSYATHSSTPNIVLEKMKKAGQEAFEKCLTELNQHYKNYTQLVQKDYEPLPYEARVLTFEELLQSVRQEQGPEFDAILQSTMKNLLEDKELDDRDRSLKIVEFVHNLWQDRDPVVILYLSPPYYPHVHVSGANDKEARLLDVLNQVAQETPCHHPLITKKFFPYISDLSYASAPQDPDIIQGLKNNMPGFGTTYDLPLDLMQDLNLPVVDIGPYGKDAHQFAERLEVDYSFQVVPKLVLATIEKLLGD